MAKSQKKAIQASKTGESAKLPGSTNELGVNKKEKAQKSSEEKLPRSLVLL